MATHGPDPDPGYRAGHAAAPVHGDADARGWRRPEMLWTVGPAAVVGGAARRVAQNGVGVQHLRQTRLGRVTEVLGIAVLVMGIGMELAQPPPVGSGQLADLDVR